MGGQESQDEQRLARHTAAAVRQPACRPDMNASLTLSQPPAAGAGDCGDRQTLGQAVAGRVLGGLRKARRMVLSASRLM